MPRARKKLPGSLKLEQKLGISQKVAEEIYGPTGKRRKPHNKPLNRPLLGIIK